MTWLCWSATSTWLGRKQLRAFLEDEWALNASLRRMSDHYGELRMPVVIVTGDKDQIVSPQKNAYRLKERIPQAQIVELRGAGHEIPLTSPDSVYSALKIISTAASDIVLATALFGASPVNNGNIGSAAPRLEADLDETEDLIALNITARTRLGWYATRSSRPQSDAP